MSSIICANIREPDKDRFKFTVRDITPSETNLSRARASKRGTALINFRGAIPESFRPMMQSREGQALVDNSDSEHSMEVDANFIGATQIYEPPPETETVAEYAAAQTLSSRYAANRCSYVKCCRHTRP